MFCPSGMCGLGLGPDLDPVDEARSAAGWIDTKIREFFDLERRLGIEFHQAAQLEAAARAAGNLSAEAEANRTRNAAFELILDYDRVKGRLEALIERVPGLGAIPVLVLIAAGAAIIAVAAAMAAIFRRATAQEAALELIAGGVLTPEEAAQLKLERSGALFSGLGMAGGIGSLIALTVAIGVGLPILGDMFTGRR